MASPKKDPELELFHEVLASSRDPLRFVNFAYPWGSADLAGSLGPREWQKDVLADIGAHLQNPLTRLEPLRIAVSSGHGPGKSGLISMITHWGLSTCEDCKIVITSNTETQLRTKSWPEIQKWFRMGINSHWFSIGATAIYSADKKHEKTWRADAIPWSDTNTEAFAGLHNQGKRIVLIYDEASAIADAVWEVAEGAMTDAGTEIIWIAFGNPTRNYGRFFDCFHSLKHRWKTRKIDIRTVEGINLNVANALVEDYGENSDVVKVRVRGEFPEGGATGVFEAAWLDKAEKECYAPAERMTLRGRRFEKAAKGELSVWSTPQPGKKYVIGSDVAEGLEHGDYSCADVLELPYGHQAAQWHGHCDPDRFADVLEWLGKWYGRALLGVERNNHGLLVLSLLRDRGYPDLYVQRDIERRGSGDKETKKLGWLTTRKSKYKIIDQLAAELRDGDSRIACADTIEECRTFVKDESGAYGAQPKCHDDRVMARAIAGEMLRAHSSYKGGRR